MNTYLNRIISFIKGPLVMFFILFYFSPQDQGYWYIFMSFGFISVIIDFGFSIILTQEVGHIFARYLDNKKLPVEFYSQVKTLGIHFIKFYIVLLIIFCLYNLVVGFFYFDLYQTEWFLYSFLLCAQFSLTPFYHIYMGIDKVNEVQYSFFFGNLLGSISLLLALYVGYGFYSLCISVGVNILVTAFIFLKKSSLFWVDLFGAKSIVKEVNKNRLKSLQKDFAISWISGYFIYNTFVPFLGKAYGIELAGQVGLIFNLASFMLTIAIVYSYNSIPYFNISIANKKLGAAKNKFIRTLYISTFLFLGFSLGFIFLQVFVSPLMGLSERFPTILITSCILFWFYLRLLRSVLSNYYRAFKIEPFRNLNILLSLVITTILFIGYVSHIELLVILILILFTYFTSSIFYVKKNHKKWSMNLK
jgi:O-antigen/teichoic acid export membrane protein